MAQREFVSKMYFATTDLQSGQRGSGLRQFVPVPFEHNEIIGRLLQAYSRPHAFVAVAAASSHDETGGLIITFLDCGCLSLPDERAGLNTVQRICLHSSSHDEVGS